MASFEKRWFALVFGRVWSRSLSAISGQGSLWIFEYPAILLVVFGRVRALLAPKFPRDFFESWSWSFQKSKNYRKQSIHREDPADSESPFSQDFKKSRPSSPKIKIPKRVGLLGSAKFKTCKPSDFLAPNWAPFSLWSTQCSVRSMLNIIQHWANRTLRGP